MRPVRQVIATATLVICTCLLVVTLASAVTPTLLIGGATTTNAKITSSGGADTLTTESGKTIKGKEFTGEGQQESATLGTFSLMITGVESAGVKCLSLESSVAGGIKVKGVVHIVFDTELPNAALAFLIEPVHVLCSAKLLTIKGCDLALVKPTNTKVAAGSRYEGIQTQAGGLANEKEYRYEEGEAIKTCELESSEGAGAFEMAGYAVTAGTATVQNNAGVNVESELMS